METFPANNCWHHAIVALSHTPFFLLSESIFFFFFFVSVCVCVCVISFFLFSFMTSQLFQNSLDVECIRAFVFCNYILIVIRLDLHLPNKPFKQLIAHLIIHHEFLHNKEVRWTVAEKKKPAINSKNESQLHATTSMSDGLF